MIEKFRIDSNFEFYCYLKAHLPDEYKVMSEPQKSYYSEWDYCYRIYKNDEMLAEYIGNFNNIEDGYLVQEARMILQRIEEEEKDANRK